MPCWMAARMIVSVRAPQLPGPSSVPRRRIVVHGFVFAGFASATTRASASSGASSPGPSRSTSANSQASFGTRRGNGTTTCARRTFPGTFRVARLLVCEDVLEHAVAADGQVPGGDMRSGGERDERGETGRPAAARGVQDREEPEREQCEVDTEDGRNQPPVDTPNCIHRDPRGEQETPPEPQAARDPEQDESASPCAVVELTRPGKKHREESGHQSLWRRGVRRIGVGVDQLPPADAHVGERYWPNARAPCTTDIRPTASAASKQSRPTAWGARRSGDTVDVLTRTPRHFPRKPRLIRDDGALRIVGSGVACVSSCPNMMLSSGRSCPRLTK